MIEMACDTPYIPDLSGELKAILPMPHTDSVKVFKDGAKLLKNSIVAFELLLLGVQEQEVVLVTTIKMAVIPDKLVLGCTVKRRRRENKNIKQKGSEQPI